MHRSSRRALLRARTRAAACACLILCCATAASAQGTRLLRQPSIGAQHLVFTYGGDLWVTARDGGEARRLTSTPAVEADPHLSPDGQSVAFTSNRSGMDAVYVVPVSGGTPTRLTWYPAPSFARGWTPHSQRVLYASARETAPVNYERLWTVAASGGPSELLPAPFAYSGSMASDGNRIALDPVSRWDAEWRLYRGGQNRPLKILNLADLSELDLPHEGTVDTQPVWLGDVVYFLSDRSGSVNVWSFDPGSGAMRQVTRFAEADVKSLSAGAGMLAIEYDGYLYTLNPRTGNSRQLAITVRGDFPWAEPRWEHVGDQVRSASLSPTGKRVLVEARGEIFTVPVEHGDARNLSRSTGAADREPLWSPDGTDVAWFSDAGGDGYVLHVAAQDGLSPARTIDLGESRLAWEATWSPDGKSIAFVDEKARVQVLDVESGRIRAIGVAGANIERGSLGLTWSPDSRWLAYARIGSNNFRRVVVWSVEHDEMHEVTNALADAHAPAWDRGGRYLYFLATTELALGSGWANTSSMRADPSYGAYVAVLRKEDPSPFPPRSDEETASEEGSDAASGEASGEEESGEESEEDNEAEAAEPVVIDWENLSHRILALPMPVARYRTMVSGKAGTVFLGEAREGVPGMTVHKFVLEDREAKQFAAGIQSLTVSADGERILIRQGSQWRVASTSGSSADDAEPVAMNLRMQLDRMEEWQQIFSEAWQYERDYFYDPSLHGRDWDAVRAKYEPLVAHVRHRTDLNYLLDQLGGELSVGHSFVGGGDYPDVDTVRVGVLGADLEPADGRWRIRRIYSSEAWNPNLTAPLARPGVRVEPGHYLLAVDGLELTSTDDPYRLLDGTGDRQTVLHVNSTPSMEGAWQEIVVPLRNEFGLRRRAWVEDNRRRVDSLSNGRLAYVWVPNTGGAGIESFDRYFFAQQDKEGAVIDERFNQGGLLDDYMVDLMTRTLRAAVTNEAPGGAPFRLPAGLLGPKVMLINEQAGSGGDFLPWVFRRLGIGPLIGTRTWGGLVAAAVHYPFVDGGYMTAPVNAVFDPIEGAWIAENVGVAPDIEVENDARAVAEGRDPQLDRAVQEALRLLDSHPRQEVRPPPYPTPAVYMERPSEEGMEME